MTLKNMSIPGVVKPALIALVIGLLIGLSGCNTVRGIGQDLERAGDAIQRSTQ